MKRYLLSILAVAIAFGVMSFDKKAGPEDMYIFQLPIGHAGSVLEAQDESNWEFIGLNQNLCTGSERACRVEVPFELVNNPETSPSLKAAANITASKTGSFAEVTGIADGGAVSNQPD